MSTVHPHSSALLAGLVALSLGACYKDDAGSSSGSGGSSSGSGGSSSGSSSSSASSSSASGGTGGESSDSAAPTTGVAASSGGEASSGDDTSAAVDCDAYCDRIGLNCTGDFTQYGSRETCMTSCAAFAPGSPGDMSGNNLACRHYHAGLAAMVNDVHCTHAGPGGDTACGSNCEGFCAIAGRYCPEAWADTAACIAACVTFPADEHYDANDVSGNSFACRLYHVTAASLDPTTHCSHIKGDSPTCK